MPLHEDDWILFPSIILFWISLVFLTKLSKEKKLTFSFNAIVHFVYLFWFIYGMCFNSDNGKGFAYWFYTLLIIILHVLSNMIQITVLLLRRKKS